LARNILPENFWPAIHMGTGIIVFLSSLIAVYIFLKWRLLYDHGNKASSC
jgi:hypothetical protein